jgi:propionyl-CoA synthetase
MGKYDTFYCRSLEHPQEFWAEAAAAIDWETKWNRVLDDSKAPLYRWFSGGRLNTCHNALDRHVDNGRGDQAALIYDSPLTGTYRTLSYRELRDQAALFAGALAANNIRKGDRVIIYMPMVPETIVAIMACARIGAVHSVVFGGFAANELATRIDDAKPKAIVSASCGIEPNRIVAYKPLLDQAIELASHTDRKSVV